MNRILVKAFKINITYHDWTAVGLERYNIHDKINIPSNTGHHYGMESFRKFCYKNIEKLELNSVNGLIVVGKNSSYYLDIDSNNRYHGYINYEEFESSVQDCFNVCLMTVVCIATVVAIWWYGYYKIKG